jgi:adenylate kinase
MTFSPPADEAIQSRLVHRSDDTEEKVKVRLQQFHANVDAVSDSYKSISVTIDGNQAPSKVTDDILSAVDAQVGARLAI